MINRNLIIIVGVLILVGSFVSAVPNPSSVYCSTLYPDQPESFGTCQYAGRGENNKVICEGDCGYGCGCYPSCGPPTSISCQNTPNEEITCICIGDSCGRPCFFPDGTNCSRWDYYYKCHPEEYPGDYNSSCAFPCGEPICKNAGESSYVFGCCEGLKEIPPIRAYDDECNESGYFGYTSICSDCGNNLCEEWENKCNCPEDCEEKPEEERLNQIELLLIIAVILITSILYLIKKSK